MFQQILCSSSIFQYILRSTTNNWISLFHYLFRFDPTISAIKLVCISIAAACCISVKLFQDFLPQVHSSPAAKSGCCLNKTSLSQKKTPWFEITSRLAEKRPVEKNCPRQYWAILRKPWFRGRAAVRSTRLERSWRRQLQFLMTLFQNGGVRLTVIKSHQGAKKGQKEPSKQWGKKELQIRSRALSE